MKSLTKKLPMIAAFLVGASLTTQASAHNDFEIDVAAGYRFPFGQELLLHDPAGETIGEGRATFDGGFVLTGIAGYRFTPDGFLYISYSRQQTNVNFEPDASSTTAFSFSGIRTIEYFQFGGNVEFTRGIVVPYMGFSLGLARVAGGEDQGQLFFAPVIDPGMKIDLHEHVHLRLLARIPLMMVNQDLVCSDAGCIHADALSPIAQLDLLGGIGVSF